MTEIPEVEKWSKDHVMTTGYVCHAEQVDLLDSFTRSILQELEEKEEENQRLREFLTGDVRAFLMAGLIRSEEITVDDAESLLKSLDSFLSESQKEE